MIDVEGINAKADAARAPCVAYWLIVFTYLMIHLFPVSHIINEPGIHDHRSSIASLLGDDWLPTPGVSEIPLVPVTAAVQPVSGFSIYTYVFVAAPVVIEARDFDPRGPPATA